MHWTGGNRASFTRHADSLGIELGIAYLKRLKLSIGYAAYLNSPEYNSLADRDYLYSNLKYTF